MNQLLSVFEGGSHLLFDHGFICGVSYYRHGLSALLILELFSNQQRFSLGCWPALGIGPGMPTEAIVRVALDCLESPSKIASIRLRVIVMFLFTHNQNI